MCKLKETSTGTHELYTDKNQGLLAAQSQLGQTHVPKNHPLSR